MEIVREFLSTVFIVNNNKVLMTWNHKVNNWIPVGGHVEKNELPCEAAIREAKEESGLDVKLVDPFSKAKTANLVQPIHIHLDHIKEDHEHINMIYLGVIEGGECFERDDEDKDLKWFTKEELEQENNLIPNVKEWAIEALNQLGDK